MTRIEDVKTFLKSMFDCKHFVQFKNVLASSGACSSSTHGSQAVAKARINTI